MLYGILSNMNDILSKTVLSQKHVPEQNFVPANNLPPLLRELTAVDTVFVVDVNHFVSVSQLYSFAYFCHGKGASVHFINQPYLNFGKSKRWKPSLADLVCRIAETEQYTKGYMRKCCRMTNEQWGYADHCIDMLSLAVLSNVFGVNGVMSRGK